MIFSFSTDPSLICSIYSVASLVRWSCCYRQCSEEVASWPAAASSLPPSLRLSTAVLPSCSALEVQAPPTTQLYSLWHCSLAVGRSRHTASCETTTVCNISQASVRFLHNKLIHYLQEMYSWSTKTMHLVVAWLSSNVLVNVVTLRSMM